jgi:hypothetical protein
MEAGPEESAVADFLQILEEHRKNCERQGKYVEAEIAKNRLEELKLHEENRRKEAMRSRQIAERLGASRRSGGGPELSRGMLQRPLRLLFECLSLALDGL